MSAVAICLLSLLLATHARKINPNGNDAQKDFSITIPTECIGQELCLSKPSDYPTDTIDRIARRLQSRSKRHNDEQIETNFDEGNGCYSSRQDIQPFLAFYNETKHLVIQSEFYKQTIPSVTCRKEGAGCLRQFKFSGTKPTCTTKFARMDLCVLDAKKLSVNNLSVSFPVDCACEVDRN